MEDVLWSVRDIAEYAYCPRLFYFMAVEGVFLPSTDTLAGLAVHRRVDRPSVDATATDDTDPERPRTVRKLALTSNTLKLSATLDLVELTGTHAVPVEYRKGRPPLSSDSTDTNHHGHDRGVSVVSSHSAVWPVDRVQIGLQVALLREVGYQVERAMIYYAASKQRIEIPADDALITEALSVLRDAQECARGPRPAPLLNSARCPRCSLQPVCLPDEINVQVTPNGSSVRPRTLWPPHTDGIQVIIQQEGTTVGVSGNTLMVRDRDQTAVREIPLASVESVSLIGAVQITTQAIGVLADRGIPLAFLSASGRLRAIMEPPTVTVAAIRRAQVLKTEQASVRCALARALIEAKISNQRVLLQRNHASLPPGILDELEETMHHVRNAPTVESVRGHEGHAAALYFRHFGGMFKGEIGAEFNENGRQRRPPPDPINACLSYGYAILAHECTAAVRIAGLDPAIGVYHVSRPGRPALAVDLMEPFRPLIVDSIALSAFNRNELTPGHFLHTSEGCVFTDAGRRAFFSAYARRLDTEVTHPLFGYRLSYRRMIILHARMIAAWLLDEIPTLSFLTTR